MNSTHYLQIALLAGDIILSNGGETHRIEDTMIRILQVGNFDNIQCFATMTYVLASVNKKDKEAITMVRCISKRTGNFEKLSMVNDFSREFSVNKINFEEAIKRLEEIQNSTVRPLHIRIFASGFLCFGVAILLGSTFLTAVYSLFIGIILHLIIDVFESNNINDVLKNIVGGFYVAFTAYLLTYWELENITYIEQLVASSTIPLVPGLSLTNSLIDIMNGHFLSGLSRLADAVLVAICIASGVVVAYKICTLLFGGAVIL